MISRWESRWRGLRRRFSRSELLVRWLGLTRSEDTATQKGLVLVQIDGLSYDQLERAIAAGRMPFLKRLLLRERYRLRPMYSGIPASTPAVQGELFYGVKSVVPAFAFRQHESGNVVQMNDSEPAKFVEGKLESAVHDPLLAGGSAYCDIYSGGAAEPHFCAATLGWGELTKNLKPWTWLWILVWYAPAIARLLGLALLELGLALYDALCGARRFPWRHELKFVGHRVAVSIGLRELATIGGTIDIARGLPIIHINFLGYDEQAHRRGPGSRFAHWTLKGIDAAIRRLWNAAENSAHRDYEVWVYSDHGQETTLPYEQFAGRTIDKAVDELLAEVTHTSGASASPGRKASTAAGRAQWLRRRAPGTRDVAVPDDDPPRVVAMGPLGYIYPPQTLDDEQCARLAERLVTIAKVPLVIWPTTDGDVLACTERTGAVRLGERAGELLGGDHPFLREIADDLADVCRHIDAGRLTISGWRVNEMPISFVPEQGGHAGPGTSETAALVIAPADAPLPPDRETLRPSSFRQAILERLSADPQPRVVAKKGSGESGTLRVLTYNVHSCVGMDAKHSPQRIARVIAQCQADVVALQELDAGRPRTGARDQAREIARELQMEFEFFPAMGQGDELYGDAVLSHLPMRLVRAAALPEFASNRHLEPRGAVWVAISVAGQEVQLINTHLGLNGDERLRQVEALLGPDWLAHENCRSPMILCGDLNALPTSRAYRRLNQRLRDVQQRLPGHRPRGTFFSRLPWGRIDHVFIDQGVDVLRIEVVRTRLARVASDHLPLLVELRIANLSPGRCATPNQAGCDSSTHYAALARSTA